MNDAKDVLHTASQNYAFGGEVASYLLSVASPGLINKVKQTAPPKALPKEVFGAPKDIMFHELQ